MRKLLSFLLLLACGAHSAVAQAVTSPPAAQVRLALNPITQKAYALDESNNRVLVYDRTGVLRTTIAVGSRPQYIAVDPSRNRVYVNNAGDASLSIIDGATDTNLTPTARLIGGVGPITVNPVTNIVYIIRFTSPATDEVTLYRPDTDTSYTMATNSWQPISMSIDPVHDEIYVAHYAGHLAVISGAYDERNDFPYTDVFNMSGQPFAVVMNPATRKGYVILDNASGQTIAVVDGAAPRIAHSPPTPTNNPVYDPPRNPATFPAIAAGHGLSPKGLALNTATNKVYAAFRDEIIVIDGANNALTYVPASTGSGPAAVAVNVVTNKIYVAADNGVLTILDGDTNTTTTAVIPPGPTSLGVNSITNQLFAFNGTVTVMNGASGAAHPIPLATSISSLPGNSSGPSASFTFTVGGTYAGLPARGVYYRLDDLEGPWIAAAGSGPFTATVSGMAGGPHTLRAFAVDAQLAPLSSGPESDSRIGAMASYSFTVASNSSVSLASGANPSRVGQPVTFTASVAATGGTPSGSVQFRDGTGVIAGCAAVVLNAGSATCTAAGLAAGSHSITAAYSGDPSFAASTSSPIAQVVQLNAATVGIQSSANPAVVGTNVKFTATVSGANGSPSGTVQFLDGSQPIAGCASATLAGGTATCSTAALALGTHQISASYSGDAAFAGAKSSALAQVIQAQPAPAASVSPASLDFGGQSMNTTSPSQSVTVSNTGSATLTVSGITLTGGGASQFAQSSNCVSVAPGTSCTIAVTFTPAIVAGASLNSSTPVTASLVISSNAASSPDSVGLAGSAEKSLVSHFYRSILGRAPEASGKQFWMDETTRVVGLGSSVNEAWYALAMTFYGSAEYAKLGRTDDGFVTDLYVTFFNRQPDDSGKQFWTSDLAHGMPREVLLAQFMFSPEFANFTQAIFGNTAVRAEIDMTGDFYRGLLGRLADSSGFGYWRDQFRTAQCQGENQVRTAADAISSSFLSGAEYAGRNRTNAQFVGDLYNAFLRRGGDLDGVKYWINQIDTGAQTREQVRRQFVASGEFSARVQAVSKETCVS